MSIKSVTPVAVLVALAITASSASAAATRAEYVAQAEAICQASMQPTFSAYVPFGKSLAKAVKIGSAGDKKRAKARIFRALGTLTGRLGVIYAQTNTQLAALTAAPGDESTVASWISARNQVPPLAAQSAAAYKHLKQKQGRRLGSQALAQSNSATAIVGSFGFNYCATEFGEAHQ